MTSPTSPSDIADQSALPAELDAALLRLDRAVAERLASAAAHKEHGQEGSSAEEAAALRARLAEREAEIARLTAALEVAERSRKEALAKVDSAAEALDAVLAGAEG